MCANYPKRHRELFCEWIDTNQPGELLLHVERASGSRQDLYAKGAIVVYMKRSYWICLLDERLWTPRYNILKYNIFIILSSLEMMSLARFCDIIHMTICLLTLWLEVNFSILSYYN